MSLQVLPAGVTYAPAGPFGFFDNWGSLAKLFVKINAAIRTRDKRAIFDAITAAAAQFGFEKFAAEAESLWSDFEKRDWRAILDDLGDILHLIAAFGNVPSPTNGHRILVAGGVGCDAELTWNTILKQPIDAYEAALIGTLDDLSSVCERAETRLTVTVLPASEGQTPETPESLETGNPLIIIAAVGLVINLLRFIRERRQSRG